MLRQTSNAKIAPYSGAVARQSDACPSLPLMVNFAQARTTPYCWSAPKPHESNKGHSCVRIHPSSNVMTVPDGTDAERGLQQEEEAFCALLDAVADYLKLREQLDQLLKAGHLKIAKARYAMGPGSVGQTHYSSSLQASTLVDVRTWSGRAFQLTGQGSQEQPCCEAPDKPCSARTQTEVQADPSGERENLADNCQNDHHHGSADTGQSVEPQSVSEYSSNAISELAAKFGTAHVDSASTSVRNAAHHDPLKWFGFMVSPHLRQAQTDFSKAAQLSILLGKVYHEMSACLSVLEASKQ